jgi:hypothetical protein
MDWFSRFVLSWELISMETGFCLATLEAAYHLANPRSGTPDQGSQFAPADFLAPLKQRGTLISGDSRGRALETFLSSEGNLLRLINFYHFMVMAVNTIAPA